MRFRNAKSTLLSRPSADAAEAEPSIPAGVQIASQWAWRVLVIAAAFAVLFWLIATLKEIVIPFLIALLISALLTPFVNFLRKHHWPRWLAIVTALVLLIVIVGGLIVLVTLEVRAGLPRLEKESVQRYADFKSLLLTSPLQIDESQIDGYIGQAGAFIQNNSSTILSGAVTLGSTAGHLLTGGLLAAFATVFMLIDGRGVWAWVVRIFPRRARAAVDGAGQSGWLTLTTFVRVQIVVAAGDAVGIGLFAFFLGLPLVIPLAVIVFLGSFIPVVGAIITGVFAVVVALVYVGPIQALIMLAGVLLVHLLEAHIVQPLVMGSAVRVHPLAVVFSVAAGTYIAGIPGALFAVPTVAVLNVVIVYVASGRWRHGVREQDEVAAARTVVET
ncbi:MAG: AI-2E family transporter [Lacisediminihabitans sp.]